MINTEEIIWEPSFNMFGFFLFMCVINTYQMGYYCKANAHITFNHVYNWLMKKKPATSQEFVAFGSNTWSITKSQDNVHNFSFSVRD